MRILKVDAGCSGTGASFVQDTASNARAKTECLSFIRSSFGKR